MSEQPMIPESLHPLYEIVDGAQELWDYKAFDDQTKRNVFFSAVDATNHTRWRWCFFHDMPAMNDYEHPPNEMCDIGMGFMVRSGEPA